VMQSKQGSAFGFPSPMIGLDAFAVVAMISIGALAGAHFKCWFWLVNAGTFFSIGYFLKVFTAFTRSIRIVWLSRSSLPRHFGM
jgi:uncharacterized membrane protein